MGGRPAGTTASQARGAAQATGIHTAPWAWRRAPAAPLPPRASAPSLPRRPPGSPTPRPRPSAPRRPRAPCPVASWQSAPPALPSATSPPAPGRSPVLRADLTLSPVQPPSACRQPAFTCGPHTGPMASLPCPAPTPAADSAGALRPTAPMLAVPAARPAAPHAPRACPRLRPRFSAGKRVHAPRRIENGPDGNARGLRSPNRSPIPPGAGLPGRPAEGGAELAGAMVIEASWRVKQRPAPAGRLPDTICANVARRTPSVGPRQPAQTPSAAAPNSAIASSPAPSGYRPCPCPPPHPRTLPPCRKPALSPLRAALSPGLLQPGGGWLGGCVPPTAERDGATPGRWAARSRRAPTAPSPPPSPPRRSPSAGRPP